MVADFSLLIGGVSKSVPVPGAYEVHLNGINDLDEVTGDAVYQSGSNYVWRGFTATCK